MNIVGIIQFLYINIVVKIKSKKMYNKLYIDDVKVIYITNGRQNLYEKSGKIIYQKNRKNVLH